LHRTAIKDASPQPQTLIAAANGEKPPADVIANAVKVLPIATGEEPNEFLTHRRILAKLPPLFQWDNEAESHAFRG
jgi:hypothetical protein